MLSFTRASTAMAMACIAATALLLAVSSYWGDAQQARSTADAILQADNNETLPLQLKMADRFAYRRIFALQEQAKWAEADALSAGLQNPVLLGKIKAQRYLHSQYTSSPTELLAWLQNYSQLAEAPRIRRLATQKGALIADLASVKPAKTPSYFPKADRKTTLRFGSALVKKYLPVNSPLRRHISELLKSERRTKALEVLSRNTDLTTLQYDVLRWWIAGSSYNHGDYRQAALLAAASAKRSGAELPMLHWLAGMAEWHLENPAQAYAHFTQMALAPAHIIPLADAAASAFWAHRAAQALGREELAQYYLKRAAATGDTFYGLQAGHLLISPSAALQTEEALSETEISALRYHASLDVILALAEIGRHADAAKELRYQEETTTEALKKPLTVISHKLQLTAPNPVLANISPAAYPRPASLKAVEASADPALLYAIIKQESGFNATAKSHRGAGGVMQLMPATAKYLMQKTGRQANWQSAPHNVVLGQAYLEVLESQPHIGNNLIYMLAAYNAGPGALSKWLQEGKPQQDPLLFIESIPYTETRNYVLQVLKNYWVYRSLMGDDKQSVLPHMLTGEWPRYAAIEATPRKLASLTAPLAHSSALSQ